MSRIIEGFWDCPYCDTKHIGGLTVQCPNCGRTRGDDIEFYLDEENKRYVSEEEVDKKVGKGVNWVCNFCNSLNSSNDTVCRFCGAGKDDKVKDYFQNLASKKSKKVTATEKSNNFVDTSRFIETPKKKENIFKRLISSKKVVLTAIIAIILGILCTTGALIFAPHEEVVTVEKFSWESTIVIEELITVDESGWELPDGGRLDHTAQEVRSHRDVIDHYETKTRQVSEQVLSHYETYVSGYRDNGNGTYTEILSQRPVYITQYRTETYQEPVYRKEPVYATKYYYEIDRWFYKCDVVASGNDKHPGWGTYDCRENEREGSRSSKYLISAKNANGEIKDYELTFEEWSSLNLGDTVRLKVYFGGKTVLM